MKITIDTRGIIKLMNSIDGITGLEFPLFIQLLSGPMTKEEIQTWNQKIHIYGTDMNTLQHFDFDQKTGKYSLKTMHKAMLLGEKETDPVIDFLCAVWRNACPPKMAHRYSAKKTAMAFPAALKDAEVKGWSGNDIVRAAVSYINNNRPITPERWSYIKWLDGWLKDRRFFNEPITPGGNFPAELPEQQHQNDEQGDDFETRDFSRE